MTLDLDTLTRLERAATQNWKLAETVKGMPGLGRTIVEFGYDGQRGFDFFQLRCDEDAELIVAMRNALPALLRLARAAVEWRNGYSVTMRDSSLRDNLIAAIDALVSR